MFVVVFALLVIVPIAELATFIAIGQWIGFWAALALLFAVSLVGALLVKRQGIGAWRRIRIELRSGQVPTTAVLDGALVLVAGVLLLLPGFLTDIVGFLLLVPPLRDLGRRLAARRMTRRLRYVDAVSSELRRPPPRLGP